MYGQLYIKNSVETKPPKQMPKSWKDGGNIEKKKHPGFPWFQHFFEVSIKKGHGCPFPIGWLINRGV